MKRKVPTRRLSSDGKVLQILFPPERKKRSAPIVLKPRTLELFAIKMSPAYLVIGTRAMLSRFSETFPGRQWYSLNVQSVAQICGTRAIEILTVGQVLDVYDSDKIHQLFPSIGQE